MFFHVGHMPGDVKLLTVYAASFGNEVVSNLHFGCLSSWPQAC